MSNKYIKTSILEGAPNMQLAKNNNKYDKIGTKLI